MFQANHRPMHGHPAGATTAGQDDAAAARFRGVAPAPAPPVLPSFTVTSSVFFSEQTDWRAFDDVILPDKLQNAVDRRKLHFRLGRFCAARALQQLNPRLTSSVLDRDPAGVPCWPDGITGSITHTNGFASAAVAWTGDAMSIGIDAEGIISPSQMRHVASVIASAAELAVAERATGDAATAATMVFCAKEAVFKALYPLVLRRFGYSDVRVSAVDRESRTFDLRLMTSLSESFQAGVALRGRYASDSEWVHAGVVIPAAHNDSGDAGPSAPLSVRS